MHRLVGEHDGDAQRGQRAADLGVDDHPQRRVGRSLRERDGGDAGVAARLGPQHRLEGGPAGRHLDDESAVPARGRPGAHPLPHHGGGGDRAVQPGRSGLAGPDDDGHAGAGGRGHRARPPDRLRAVRVVGVVGVRRRGGAGEPGTTAVGGEGEPDGVLGGRGLAGEPPADGGPLLPGVGAQHRRDPAGHRLATGVEPDLEEVPGQGRQVAVEQPGPVGEGGVCGADAGVEAGPVTGPAGAQQAVDQGLRGGVGGDRRGRDRGGWRRGGSGAAAGQQQRERAGQRPEGTRPARGGAGDGQPGRRAPAHGIESTSAYLTLLREFGAWMIWPPPTYRATWVMPL